MYLKEVSTPALKTVLKSHFLWDSKFFVEAGASHVYAIEAAAARQIVKDNGFCDVVIRHRGTGCFNI